MKTTMVLVSIVSLDYVAGYRSKPIQLRLIPRGSTERYSPKVPPSHTLLQPIPNQIYPPRSPCSPHPCIRYHSQRRGSSPQAPPQILYGSSTVLRAPNSAQSSPPGPRSPRLGVAVTDPWNTGPLKTRRSSGEMEWLTAPGFPCSRKNSWSSVSTDFGDFSSCW